MKSMEEYINDVYQRYEESERNHEVYKKVRMTRKRPLTTLCSVTACLLVACVCFIGYEKYNTPPVFEDNPVFAEKNENEGKSVVYTKYIDTNSFINKERLKRIIMYSDIIVTADSFEKVETNAIIKNNKVFINSVIKLSINKTLKEEWKIKDSSVEYYTIGGKISLSILEKNIDYDWNEWEKVNLGLNIPEEEKPYTYYEMLIEKAEVLEKGKQYLVFLSKENDIYSLADDVYGIMEYDPVTNKVKNIDTGEFEEFDWDLLTDK